MGRRDQRPGGSPPAIASFALLLFAHTAVGAPDARVAVDVGVVVASHEGTTMDPALSSLRNQLQSMFNYSYYRMVDRLKRSLSVGETGEFVLPGNRSMRVTPAPAKADQESFAVQVQGGEGKLRSTHRC